MINWKEVYPKMKSIKEKSFLFCGEMKQYFLEMGRSEHIMDATKLTQKIYHCVLWDYNLKISRLYLKMIKGNYNAFFKTERSRDKT